MKLVFCIYLQNCFVKIYCLSSEYTADILHAEILTSESCVYKAPCWAQPFELNMYLFICEQFLQYIFRIDSGVYGWNTALSYEYSSWDEHYEECTYVLPGRLFYILKFFYGIAAKATPSQ